MKLTEREIFKLAMDKAALELVPHNKDNQLKQSNQSKQSKQNYTITTQTVYFNNAVDNAVDNLCTTDKVAKYKSKTYVSKAHARGCVRKKKYMSNQHANAKIKQTNHYMRAYLCDFCDFWHLTSQLPRPKRYVINLTQFTQLDELKIKLLQQIDEMFDY